MKPKHLNFQVDHMTLLLQPRLYSVAYAIFRVVFGVDVADILYDKRKEWARKRRKVDDLCPYAWQSRRNSSGADEHDCGACTRSLMS